MTDEAEHAPTGSANRSYDALWERVDNQGAAIRGLALEIQNQFRDSRADATRQNAEYASTLKALDAKLDTNAQALNIKLETTQHAFNSKIETSSMALNERQRPQYIAMIGAMIAAVTVSVTIMQWQTSLHDKPYDNDISAVKAGILAMSTTVTALAGSVPTNKSFEQTIDYLKQISDLKSTESAAALEKVQDQLDKVENSRVPRDELDYKQKTTDALLKDLQARQHELEIRVASEKAKS